MSKVLKWLLVLIAVGLCGLIAYAYSWMRQYQALADDEPVITLSPNGVPLKMDLYFPAASQAPWQVLVYAHGGSFTSGDKLKGSGVIDIPAMTARGYAVAAINYRLMPANPFPAEVLDAKCAIRFLRAHAAEYQLDTEKIGIWGGSAGGHLVAMVGLTNGNAAFDAGEYPEQSSREAISTMMADFFDLWLKP